MAKLTGTLILTAAVVALAGCAAPTPPPSETSAVGCDPATAEITWSPAVDGGRVPAGAQLITYTDGGITRMVEVTTLDPGIEITDAALDELGDGWRSVLLDDLDRTGQIDENFGAEPRIPAEPVGEPLVPLDGQFVVAVDVPLAAFPFVVDCGEESVVGTVTGTNGGLGYTLLDCADPIEGTATEVEISARAHCEA